MIDEQCLTNYLLICYLFLRVLHTHSLSPYLSPSLAIPPCIRACCQSKQDRWYHSGAGDILVKIQDINKQGLGDSDLLIVFIPLAPFLSYAFVHHCGRLSSVSALVPGLQIKNNVGTARQSALCSICSGWDSCSAPCVGNEEASFHLGHRMVAILPVRKSAYPGPLCSWLAVVHRKGTLAQQLTHRAIETLYI